MNDQFNRVSAVSDVNSKQSDEAAVAVVSLASHQPLASNNSSGVLDVVARMLPLLGLLLPAIGVIARWFALGFDSEDVTVAVAASLVELATVGGVVLVIPLLTMALMLFSVRSIAPSLHELHLAQPALRRLDEAKARLESSLPERGDERARLAELSVRSAALRNRLDRLQPQPGDSAESIDDVASELDLIKAEGDSIDAELKELHAKAIAAEAQLTAEIEPIQQDLDEVNARYEAAQGKAPAWLNRFDPPVVMLKVFLAFAAILAVVFFPGFPAFQVQMALGWVAGGQVTKIAARTGTLRIADVWPIVLVLGLAGTVQSAATGSVPGLHPVIVQAAGLEESTYYRVGSAEGRLYLASCSDRSEVTSVPLEDASEVRSLSWDRPASPSLFDILFNGSRIRLGLASCPSNSASLLRLGFPCGTGYELWTGELNPKISTSMRTCGGDKYSSGSRRTKRPCPYFDRPPASVVGHFGCNQGWFSTFSTTRS